MNIAEILKDKPKGTKLYDYLHNKEVKFDNIISVNGETSIWCVRTKENNVVVHHGYSELGTLRGCEDGLQILMPSKDMRDWYKFAWKKGAILVSNDGETVVMFFDWANDAYTEFLGAKFPVKKEEGKSTFNTCDFESCCQDYNIEFWVNPTTGESSVKTVRITVGNSEPNEPNMPIEPKYSFKPFDKVIVRRKDNYNIWQANIFSHIVEKGYYACIMGVWSDILPYNEETAKLVGTTKSLEDIR